MTDRELIEKKLSFILTCLRELKDLANIDAFTKDIKEERFILHTLQIAIQAAQDIASHIVSDLKFGEPETNRDLFLILFKNGWLSEDMANTMSSIIGFRNILVHGYQTVKPEIVKMILKNHLQDLELFVEQINKQIK